MSCPVITKVAIMIRAIRMGRPQAVQNIANHGVPFDYAARVFLHTCRRDSEDSRRIHKEGGAAHPGKIEGRLFAAGLYSPRPQPPVESPRERRTHGSKESIRSVIDLTLRSPGGMTPAEERRFEANPLIIADIRPLNGEFFKKATAAWPPPNGSSDHIASIARHTGWLKANGRGNQTGRWRHRGRSFAPGHRRRCRAVAILVGAESCVVVVRIEIRRRISPEADRVG